MIRKPLVSRSSAQTYGLVCLLALLALLIALLWASSTRVSALPEYTVRTGESCTACHVNAGGGGPRTLRGLLWAARGRPDHIPELPGVLIAPRVADPVESYEIACGGCHGYKGEGLSAMGLVNTNISQTAIRSFTLYGIPKLGMPGFEGQFTGDQLDHLVLYVAGLSSGEIIPPMDTYDLPPASFSCGDEAGGLACGDHILEAGGN